MKAVSLLAFFIFALAHRAMSQDEGGEDVDLETRFPDWQNQGQGQGGQGGFGQGGQGFNQGGQGFNQGGQGFNQGGQGFNQGGQGFNQGGQGFNQGGQGFNQGGQGQRPTRPNRPTSRPTDRPTRRPTTPVVESSTESQRFRTCVSNCQATPQYDPVCGTNGVTYDNVGRMNCAKRCGAVVEMDFRGTCQPL